MNHYSMALRARLYNTTLLLTGDLTERYEMYAAVPADVLKAAHHGASDATSEAFLQAVQPNVVLQSCGHADRVEELRARLAGPALYATQQVGAITLRIEPEGYTVLPYRTFSDGKEP